MQSIAKDVYIADKFQGVTVGAVNLSHGLIQIDAPPSPEDGHTWRAALLNLSGSSERILVTLDTHPDRTLGARLMDCPVVSQEKAMQVFRSRPVAFKAQGDETGADWESIPGLSNIRWTVPEICFSHHMTLHWGDISAQLEYHPGPSIGSSWVVLPEVRVIFVGDAVVCNQPPFLTGADIPNWLETLKQLLSPAYRDYIVVAGRGGVAPAAAIKAQIEFLNLVKSRLEKLAAQHAAPDSTEDLVPSLSNILKYQTAHDQRYTQRLRYGLRQYYLRHYHASTSKAED